MKVPLAEHFHSLQGEGYWVGTPMHFLRLPGCSVGRTVTSGDVIEVDRIDELSQQPVLSTGKRAWLCRTWGGHPFWCDTDFGKYQEVELSDLLSETWEQHICITGGEPLIHKEVLSAIEQAVFLSNTIKGLHIETSGTILRRKDSWKVWITCSPKVGYLPDVVRTADELKLLIHSDSPDSFPAEAYSHPRVYLSPINGVGAHQYLDSGLSLESFNRCRELLRSHPTWRLSVQLHKYLGLP